MKTDTPNAFLIERSAYEALNRHCLFTLVHGYLRSRSVGGVARVPNKEASEYFGVTPRYITAAITALRKAGLITHHEYDGRNRIVYLAK
jgi:hypothetical protein